ncbi:MAG: tetratricopeptide repeat-containing sensor histidine kinase [Mucilaginibacter sp.]
MKKLLSLLIFLFAISHFALAQKSKVDSLQKAYNKTKQDTTRVQLLEEKSGAVFLTTNRDSGMLCAQQALALSRKINFAKGEVRALSLISTYLNRDGDLPGSLKIAFETLPKAKAINDTRGIMSCYNTIGLTYSTLKDYQKALDNYYEFKNIGEKYHVKDLIVVAYNNIGREYIDYNKYDSAYYYIKKAYDVAIKTKMTKNIGYPIRSFGIIEFKKGNFKKAIDFYNQSIKTIPGGDNHYLMSEDYRRMAEAYQKLNTIDSSVYFGRLALEQARLDKDPEQVMRATELLTNVYQSKSDFKQAFSYQQIMLKARDSLFSQQKTLQVQNLNFEEEQRRQDIETAKVDYQNRVRFYALLGVIAVFVLIAGILLYANSQRKKANHLLHEQKEEIAAQRDNLEQAYSDLKITQTQLVQSEKMASLGELTAGIAHEIQNPLNFVNNFSEVNTELIDEMAQEMEKGNLTEVKAIAADIKTNQLKISQHGKRADFIVKGMLQHSRTSTGEKEPTYINVLGDEFFKLSFHGLRAKDKNFNAEMVTHFDPNLPKVNLAQQEIGRVLLNMYNNAFYAVNQKAKTAPPGYKPEVSVSTASENGQVIIKVRDNGNGIPAAIRDKIMQPFFTTKPTGEGTGLGLSLSYDIVVKGHGGKIDIDTKEGEFTEFTVTLPLS